MVVEHGLEGFAERLGHHDFELCLEGLLEVVRALEELARLVLEATALALPGVELLAQP